MRSKLNTNLWLVWHYHPERFISQTQGLLSIFGQKWGFADMISSNVQNYNFVTRNSPKWYIIGIFDQANAHNKVQNLFKLHEKCMTIKILCLSPKILGMQF